MEEKSPKLKSPMLMMKFYQKFAKTAYPPPSTSGVDKKSLIEEATTNIMSQIAKVEVLAKTRSTKNMRIFVFCCNFLKLYIQKYRDIK